MENKESELINNDDAKTLNGQTSGGNKLHKSKSENDKISDNASSHSQLSRSNKSVSSSATTKGFTKVYYHIDDEPTPYCTDVPVEVKVEIRDDQQLLFKSSNGQFELFLLTAEGSSHSHSDGASSASFSKIAAIKRTVPGPAPFYPLPNSHLCRPRYRLDAPRISSAHRHKPFEDSTIYTTETEGRIYSDDESRLSTSTDNITSVSRQHYSMHRRKRRQFQRTRRQPSRTSSLSSMTETSMALEVITLNMNTVNFLGISIVGQSYPRGDNGIYANVMPGGAVALDGRIEPGDMILQVNDVSFENFKNDQAVDVLKRAVNTRGPIKLTVAKSFDAGRTNYFSVPSREPVRPIDTHAWVQHTNAIRGMTSTLVNAMNAIPEGSEGTPTPIPGQYPPSSSSLLHTFAPTTSVPNQRPASSSTSTGSGGGGAAQTIVGPGGVVLSVPHRLDVHSDKRKVILSLAMPNSGLDIRDRTWLKIPIPKSFLGSALIDWLIENVEGLKDRKEARKYASALLKDKLIAHVVNKVTFTEQCYYIFGEESAELLNMRASFSGDGALFNVQQQFQHIEMANHQGAVLYPTRPQEQPHFMQQTNFGAAASMISEYASMPSISPYPAAANIFAMQNAPIAFPPRQSTQIYGPMAGNHHNKLPRTQEQFGATTSQTSNNSNEGSSGSEQRRKAILPPAPSLTSVGPPNPAFPPPQQRHLPAEAPPTTPIGDDGVQRFGQPSLQKVVGNTVTGRVIRLSDNFPEVLVEHF
uniref:Segment polarity protein dishevelled homolog DVL-3 n=1 Tax=Globodera pallida TaxID=36090 RepID=A0A183BSZ8_GLOPA